MSAAAQAAQQGARVLVCELADHLGGTAVLSTGNVWTVTTAEAFRQADPDGDVTLWQAVRDDLDACLQWIAELGVSVTERHRSSSSSTYDPPPIGKNVDIETFMARGSRLVELAGGWVLNGTTVNRLDMEGGRVCAAEVRDRASGEVLPVSCEGVVLATGGFQNSFELCAHYLGERVADAVRIRSNPHSDGAGLRLALEAGAATSARMDTFYGVLLPALPGSISEQDFRGLVLHSAVCGVVLGPDGRRLTDESAGAVRLANQVAQVRRGVIVVGAHMVEASEDQLGIDLLTVMKDASTRGARFLSGATREDLYPMLTGWGYDGVQAQLTTEDFDRHIAAGSDLSPDRRRHRMPLGERGLAVLEVQAAMTSTFGGIRTDEFGQALLPDGTTIPGLFVAGVDQGGYNVSGYVGGLSRSLVFGCRAAQRAIDPRGPKGVRHADHMS